MIADKHAAKLIAEMRSLLPAATPAQREQIIEMIERCVQKFEVMKTKKNSGNQDYLDER